MSNKKKGAKKQSTNDKKHPYLRKGFWKNNPLPENPPGIPFISEKEWNRIIDQLIKDNESRNRNQSDGQAPDDAE